MTEKSLETENKPLEKIEQTVGSGATLNSSQKFFNARDEARKLALGKPTLETIPEVVAEKVPLKDKENKPVVTSSEPIKDDEKPEESQVKIKEEMEVLKKRYEDNRNYAKDSQRRLSEVKKTISKLEEDVTIDSATAQMLLKAIESGHLNVPDDLKSKAEGVERKEEDRGFFAPLLDTITKDVWEQYLEVTEDKDYQEKTTAFDRLVAESSVEEQKEIFAKVIESGKTPIKILKSMLSIGDEFLKNGFSDYLQAGGLKKYTSSWQEKNNKLQQEIDKMKKKLLEYESNIDKPAKMNIGKSSYGGDAPNRILNPREEAAKVRLSQM